MVDEYLMERNLYRNFLFPFFTAIKVLFVFVTELLFLIYPVFYAVLFYCLFNLGWLGWIIAICLLVFLLFCWFMLHYHWAKAKGYSGLFGLLALAPGIGCIVLGCFKDKMPPEPVAPPNARVCPQCGMDYFIEDYRPDIEKTFCSFCKTELPGGVVEKKATSDFRK